MTRAIQRAYYKEERNPSDDETLIELASELGIDAKQFSSALNTDEVKHQLQEEIDFSKKMFVESFPSLVLVTGETHFPILINYNDYKPMLESIENQLSCSK